MCVRMDTYRISSVHPPTMVGSSLIPNIMCVPYAPPTPHTAIHVAVHIIVSPLKVWQA